MDESKVLTISGLTTFLTEIEELKGKDISVSEQSDGWVISIGDSDYYLESPEESVVEASADVIDSVDLIDQEGWDAIDDVIEEEPIEGGIIKELVKTLAIGGLVRLTKNVLTKS